MAKKVSYWDENGEPVYEAEQAAPAAPRRDRTLSHYDEEGKPVYAVVSSSKLMAEDKARAVSERNKARGTGFNFGDAVVNSLGFQDETAALAAWITQNAENLARSFKGEAIQIDPADAAEAAARVSKEEATQYATDHPILNNVAKAGAFFAAAKPSFAAGPAGFTREGARRIAARDASRLTPAEAARQGYVKLAAMPSGRETVRQAAIGTGLAVTPTVVAQQEGDLPERLEKSALPVAIAAATGGTLRGVSNRLLDAPAPQADAVADFEAANVRPTTAAVGGEMARRFTKAIGENPIAGIFVRQRLRDSIDDTERAVGDLSGRFGTARPVDQIGGQIQEGVERFANGPAQVQVSGTPRQRFWQAANTETRDFGSFGSKADAMYEAFFDRIEAIERTRANRWTRSQGPNAPGWQMRPNAPMQPPSQVTTANTAGALRDIMGRVEAPNVANIINDGRIENIANAITQDAATLRFADLRALRTWVREAQRNPQLRQTLDDAALQRLEQALTTDIRQSVRNIGGAEGVRQLETVDGFYREGQQAIQTALQPFADAGSPEAAMRKLMSAASQGAGADFQRLVTLKQSLSPQEWGDISATVLSNLGRPSPGAAGAGTFSINTFVTNYNKLSPQGRAVLFGELGGGGPQAAELRQALETLARVADRQKAVEAAANHSNTAVAGQAVATIGGLMVKPAETGSIIAGLAITGEMLTNPAFVRWLSSVPSNGSPAGLRVAVSRLQQLATKDPALVPVYEQLAGALAPKPDPLRDTATPSQP